MRPYGTTPKIDEWLSGNSPELFALAREWFARFRNGGTDVTS